MSINFSKFSSRIPPRPVRGPRQRRDSPYVASGLPLMGPSTARESEGFGNKNYNSYLLRMLYNRKNVILIAADFKVKP